jgi:hypothetical protein
VFVGQALAAFGRAGQQVETAGKRSAFQAISLPVRATRHDHDQTGMLDVGSPVAARGRSGILPDVC